MSPKPRPRGNIIPGTHSHVVPLIWPLGHRFYGDDMQCINAGCLQDWFGHRILREGCINPQPDRAEEMRAQRRKTE